MNPKVITGGGIVIAGSGGAGYAISRSVNTTSSRKLSEIKANIKEKTYAEKIKNSGFELLTETTNQSSEWEKIVTANTKSDANPEKPTKEQLQEECAVLLDKVFEGTEITDDYKNAVKKCTKKEGLKEKLQRLGLDLLQESDHTTLKDRWDTISGDQEFKAELKATYSYDLSASGKNTHSEANAKELIKQCTKYSSNNDSYSADIEKKWNRFLTMCSKDKENKTYANHKDKNYWNQELNKN